MNVYKTAQSLSEVIQKLCSVKVEGKNNWKLMTESVEELEMILHDMVTLINRNSSSEDNSNENTGI